MAGTTPGHDSGTGIGVTAKTYGADPSGKSLSILLDAAQDEASQRPKIACAKKLISQAPSTRFHLPDPSRKIFRFRFFRNRCLLPASRARSRATVLK